MLRRLAGESERIQHQSTRGTDAVWQCAENVRFEQVPVNLGSNAKDAMPGVGTLRNFLIKNFTVLIYQ